MKIQDFGIGIGIFFICIATGLGFVVYLGSSFDIDFSELDIPYLEQSPFILGGFGVFLAVISLISLSRSK